MSHQSGEPPEQPGEHDGLSAETLEMLEADAGMGVELGPLDDVAFELDCAPHEEATIGFTALEKLIAALILARPSNQATYVRLRDAMAAITGTNRYDGNDNDDRHCLLWMAAQELRQIAIMNPKRESFWPGIEIFGGIEAYQYLNPTELARGALDAFGMLGKLPTQERSAARRLVGKWKHQREDLLNQVRHASIYPHQFEHEHLLNVARIMNEMGVQMDLPGAASAYWWRSREK